MKSYLLVMALVCSGPVALACECVNVSGNPSMDDYCQDLGADGDCAGGAGICQAVANCVNISGNPSMDDYCQDLGEDNICSNAPGICLLATCN